MTAAKKIYTCKECGMNYEKEHYAKACESWCKEHNSCNMEIIKYAIKEE